MAILMLDGFFSTDLWKVSENEVENYCGSIIFAETRNVSLKKPFIESRLKLREKWGGNKANGI